MQKLFLHRKWLWENHYKVVKEQISFSGGAGGRLCFPQCWCKQAESPLLPADAITALRSGAAGGEQRWCSAPCNKCLCRALGRSVPAAIHTRTHPSSPALFHFLLLTHAAASEQGWILLWLFFFYFLEHLSKSHLQIFQIFHPRDTWALFTFEISHLINRIHYPLLLSCHSGNKRHDCRSIQWLSW